jgi:hypothetical protein
VPSKYLFSDFCHNLGWDNRFKVGGVFSGKEPIGEFFEVLPRRG